MEVWAGVTSSIGFWFSRKQSLVTAFVSPSLSRLGVLSPELDGVLAGSWSLDPEDETCGDTGRDTGGPPCETPLQFDG
jgi:hypothetical protein